MTESNLAPVLQPRLQELPAVNLLALPIRRQRPHVVLRVVPLGLGQVFAVAP
jgi:hypothetical protein